MAAAVSINAMPNAHKKTAKTRPSLQPLYVFAITTVVCEAFLVFMMPAILRHYPNFHKTFFLDGAIVDGLNFPSSLNHMIQTLWTSQIIGLIAAGIFLIMKRRNYKLGTVWSPNVAALIGIYGLYFGYYYPSGYSDSIDPALDSVWPYLVRADLWLIGGLVAGWLLGKGLECGGKRAFWVRS
jgi:hypothetical protein